MQCEDAPIRNSIMGQFNVKSAEVRETIWCEMDDAKEIKKGERMTV